VIHIGSGKAGSTTIQNTFHHHREALLQAGVLVPHEDGARFPERQLEAALCNAELRPREAEIWHSIQAQVAAANPDVLFISNEHAWMRIDGIETFAERLGSLGGSIEILLFLREPSDYFRSTVQQMLKAAPTYRGPKIWQSNQLRNLQAWHDVFGDALKVTAFQRSSLREGDIIRHIQMGELPAAAQTIDMTSDWSNISECAEVTELTRRYIETHYGDEPRRFRKDANLFRERLNEVAAAHKLGTKAKLRPEVRDLVLANARDDLIEMRARWGVSFDTLDYDALPTNTDNPLSGTHIWNFDEICPLDEAVMLEIMMHYTREYGLPQNLTKS